MSVRKSMMLSYVLSLGTTVVFITGSVIINRLLTPAQFGVFAIGMAVYNILMAVQQLGLSSYIVREERMTPDKYGSAATLLALQALLLCVLLLASAGPIARFQREPEIASIVMVFAVTCLLWAVQTFYNAILMRHQRFATISAINLVNMLIVNITSVGLALAGLGALSMALGILAGNVALTAGAWFMARKLADVRLSRQYWPEQLRFGMTSIVQAIIWAANVRLLPLVIGRLLGVAAVGYYTRAQSMRDMSSDYLLDPILRNFLASIAKARSHSDGGYAWSVLRLHRVRIGLTMPVLLAVAVLAGPCLNLLFGSQWQPAQAPLTLLAIGTALASISGGAREVMLVNDRRGLCTSVDAIRLVLLIGVILLVGHHGIVVVAWVKLAEMALGAVAELFILQSQMALDWRVLLRQIWHGVCISLVAVAPALAYMVAMDWPYAAPFWHLAGLGLAWGLLLLLCFRLIRHDLWDELMKPYALARQRIAWLPALS